MKKWIFDTGLVNVTILNKGCFYYESVLMCIYIAENAVIQGCIGRSHNVDDLLALEFVQ